MCAGVCQRQVVGHPACVWVHMSLSVFLLRVHNCMSLSVGGYWTVYESNHSSVSVCVRVPILLLIPPCVCVRARVRVRACVCVFVLAVASGDRWSVKWIPYWPVCFGSSWKKPTDYTPRCVIHTHTHMYTHHCSLLLAFMSVYVYVEEEEEEEEEEERGTYILTIL